MILNQCGMDLYKVWSHNNQTGGEGLPTKPCFSYIFNPLYTIIHRHNNQEGGITYQVLCLCYYKAVDLILNRNETTWHTKSLSVYNIVFRVSMF